MAELDVSNIAAASISTPGAGVTAVFVDGTNAPTKRLRTKDDAGTVIAYVGQSTTDTLTNKSVDLATNTVTGTTAQFNTALSDNDFATLAGSEVLTNKTLTNPITSAGTTGVASMTITAGTNLTNAIAGGIEADATGFYKTINTTSGRQQDVVQSVYRTTSNGSALGAAITDYFPATSSFPTVTNGVYLLKYYLWFLKTTAGTVTWTITNTQAYTNAVAWHLSDAVGGVATNAATTGDGIVTNTTAAMALPVAAGNLTTAVNHYHEITALVECGTAGNIRLRVTSSAGTVTPLRGSFYTAQQISANNIGTFVA